MKKDKIILFSLIGVIILFFISVFIIYPYLKYSSPKRAIHVFKTRICAEDQIIHPLIVCGPKVVPYLFKELEEKAKGGRGYIITAMGHIGAPSAIPGLLEILQDENENHFIKYYTLMAIAMIDLEYARSIAPTYQDKGIEYLSEFAQALIENRVPARILKRRTRWEALFDKHE